MKVLSLLLVIAGAPSTAFGQGAIVGSVKDASGAPLSGVVVTAMSPDLIRKVRSAVTTESGQYRIEDLRPGLHRQLLYNTSFVSGGTWLEPIAIMTPRFIRLIAEVNC